MCGIAGIVRFDGKPIEPASLDAMQRAIRHRGPDGEGRYVTPQCALLHARLSIIDIEGGAQPMHVDADEKGGALTVVFNGEIYNHRELRAELVKLGHKFVTDHSDTEVLLHGYREWGARLCDKLDGMYAFGLWDETARTLFLSRDPAGKKPLFLRSFPKFSDPSGGISQGLMFASVPSALSLADGVLIGVDRKLVGKYLALGYPTQTVSCEVSEVGEGISWEASGPQEFFLLDESKSDESDMWKTPGTHRGMLVTVDPNLDFVEEAAPTKAGNALNTADSMISRAVEARLEADVPLGCFLSGGIDSTIVAAKANEILRKRGAGPLHTFTVAMPDAAYDESKLAERVAQRLGTIHRTLAITPSAGLFSDLQYLIGLTGEPLADSSILPTYWLCKAAREHVKVALSGDGGDEGFAGYDRYRAMWLLARFRPALSSLAIGPFGSGSDGRSWSARLGRLMRAARHKAPRAQYEEIVHIFSPEQISAILPGETGHLDLTWQRGDVVAAAIEFDRRHYLPGDVLRKIDRASMAAGLEVRSPLLSREIMNWTAKLTSKELMPRGKPKAILRQLAEKLVGSDIASLPKRGFGLPIGGWFATSLHDELRQRLMDGPLDTLGFQKPVIQTMLDEHKARSVDHTHRLFALLALSMWVESVPGVRMGA